MKRVGWLFAGFLAGSIGFLSPIAAVAPSVTSPTPCFSVLQAAEKPPAGPRRSP